MSAGLAILAATPAREAISVLPSEDTSAIHVAARAGSAFWAQLLVWVCLVWRLRAPSRALLCFQMPTHCLLLLRALTCSATLPA